MPVRRLVRYFETLIAPTGTIPLAAPPDGTVAFFWYFARQARGVLAALLLAGMCTAGFDLLIPVCIGRIAGLVANHSRETLLRDEGGQLAAMGVLILIARPAALVCEFLITNQAINPSFANRVRWQSHWHVIRQSWTFFQNDFAGRIANRVIQTGPALRDVLVVGVDAVWYIVLYGGSSIVLLGAVDWRLAVPIAAWFVLYAALLWVMVPRLRTRSRANSEGAVPADRARGGQLHEHPDGQAVRAGRGRGRFRARGVGGAHGDVPGADTGDHGDDGWADAHQCRAAGGDRRGRGPVVGSWARSRWPSSRRRCR